MSLPHSERVRQRLARRLWTGRSAATDMGVDHSELSGFLSDKRRISITVLDRIVAWLDEQDMLDEQVRKP